MTLTAPTIKYAVINASSSGANTVVAAVAAKKIQVINYTIVAVAPVTATWYSAAAAISGPIPLGTLGGVAPKGDAWAPVLSNINNNENLVLNLSSAVAVGGHLAYIET